MLFANVAAAAAYFTTTSGYQFTTPPFHFYSHE